MTKQIVLKKNEERRIVAGHPWVFSNEIRETKGDPSIGDIVELRTAGGLLLGIGFYNPHSLIAFRLLSQSVEEIDAGFFRKRIEQALTLREPLGDESSASRIVHGEGDFLPGLVVDRFNDLLVVQTYSYGMDLRLPVVVEVLQSLLHPSAIIERNESPLRLLEHLPQRKGVLSGSETRTVIHEHGLRYAVDVLEGQKTGFFIDQKDNRAAMRRFSRGAKVLDCFCNDGGFALNAAAGGATAVLGVDSSRSAIERAVANAHLNDATTVRFQEADVFEKLKSLAAEAEEFDVIVLDPPSFTKNRKTVPAARKGYKELHMGAFQLLRRGGTLLTASCSHHLESEAFLETVDRAARASARKLQLLEWRGASPDHPTLPAVPETRYLKFGIFRVL